LILLILLILANLLIPLDLANLLIPLDLANLLIPLRRLHRLHPWLLLGLLGQRGHLPHPPPYHLLEQE
jgi:hypothetical protein